MFIVFCTGFILGGAVGWFFWWSSRRENVRLDEEKQLLVQEKLIVFDFMHNLVEAIGDGVTRQQLFQHVVHAAILSTGALSACIFELRGTKLQGVAIEGLFPPHRPLPQGSKVKLTTRAKFIEQILKSETFDVGEGLVGLVAQTAKGLIIEDARNDPRIVRHNDPSLQVRSLIAVPIAFKNELIAVLAIVNPSDGGGFGETDFSLAMSLGEQAGLAIHNLDLMSLQIEKNKLDVDLGLAREIQSMLLPSRYPHNDCYDIAAVYLPAQKVGGDLYDIFELSGHRLGIAIADVSGKGIPASLLMAICQTNLRHLARQIESPAQVLVELNKVMVRDMRQDMFITLTYVVADPERNTLRIARAGHELPIMVRRSELDHAYRAEMVKGGGMALGMVEDAIFQATLREVEIPFAQDDVFTLYTDGVTESVNSDGTEFSNGRLADILRTLRSRPAREINQGVMDKVALFTGSSGRLDDFTLVTIKRVCTTEAPDNATHHG